MTIGTKTEQEAKFKTLLFGFLVTLMTASLLLAAAPAYAKTFVINSVGDDSDAAPAGVCNTGPFQEGTEPECTLRAAIQEANATAEADTIEFSIGLGGVQTISPTTLLPTVTQPVTIDGYTETGASENTKTVGNDANLLIRLNKGAETAPSGLILDTNNSVVRGLSITGFSSGVGLVIKGDNNTVEGNFIGTDPGGVQGGLGNFTGVIVQNDSSNNLVGGTSPGARNLISGNRREGLRITTDNGETGNRVEGNYIGTTKSGSGDLGNEEAGVIVDSSAHTIGGATRDAANVIAFNGQHGGVLVGDSFAPEAVSILGNSIYNNGGLGIDLNDDGVTPNDGPGDPDTGPNNLQNFPVITSAKTGRRATTIKGALDSTANTTFTIQLFSNPKSARDEGKTFIGQKTVAIDASGQVSFTFKPPKKVKPGLFVTATATNDATNDTSEFSAAKKVSG
jgi:CSLREA domain-containing protein